MIAKDIAALIHRALEAGLIESVDTNYVRNQVMHLLQMDTFPENVESQPDETIPDILEKLIAYAVREGVIYDVFDEKEILSANIMNCFVARPSTVNAIFFQKYEESPEAATNYFYKLSKDSNYIQMNRINKNISYKAETDYGQMDITINLSKPEKDPEQIKREREMKQTAVNYPKCLLCKENEGYTGRTAYPARANHRIIHVPLLGEDWYLQYSPYVYYNEHSILLSGTHRNMKIDRDAFTRLLTFVERFPHYFIGSNADLPIVGGSILSHDHYQAGRYEFAMTQARDAFTFELDAFPSIEASVVKWPMSVIRLRSNQKEHLVEAADHILRTWRNYSDESADILSFSGDTPHNTITPIARKREARFELDLVLRNNRTTAEHPLGIFHPHAEVHHIKKENIGLIEVMGLAVLPPRLKNELAEIRAFLLGETCDVADYHIEWAEQLKAEYGTLSDLDQAQNVVEKELGKKFVRVLEDAGVFKDRAAFKRFIKEINK
ncbi:UDP-glucose--hexose-1-phosphate uridylyltransferase [Oceanobacillus bengalensis]|uniref:Galactose-1-phosphate uridylyltransferase n=1 Tax=Oceanobacillus bengalensis TaxID=1435466 RepID=A0A494YTL5_9BACI|nr:UDP-glucose--hexose-1-phosphate uridylyltransferase [Oceanobacillus bengalensis]RKQ13477.1 UDP-glucose--hexose-1-phosphate uridylyltransferase [Oceanobacillus bengalensis]